MAQDKRASTVIPLSKQERTGLDAKGQAIRTITPGSTSSSGMAGTAPSGSSPSVALSPNPSATPKASNDPGVPERQSDTASIAALETKAAPGGIEGLSVTTGGSLDLNTASVEQLNALGAGMIGKRIIEFRPYGSPDELLARRVLKRSDYDVIKDLIVVR
ncbi:helix-hairpin-helix domain-containing protein [Methylobacterium mesophilicum]